MSIQRKYLEIQKIKIYFRTIGKPSADNILILLHGWNLKGGESWESFLSEFLFQENFFIILPDMPCFGKSEDLKEVWGVYEYAEFITNLVSIFKIKYNFKNNQQISLMGHSFGGAVATLVAIMNSEIISKLVLVAPAIIRESENTNLNLKKKLTKVGKLIFQFPFISSTKNIVARVWYKIIGSPDYNQTSGIKRKIMQKIITQDTLNEIQKIKQKTLLLWGTKDKYTPFNQSNKILSKNNLIQLVTFDNINHGVHLYAKKRLFEEIKNFLIHTK